MSISILDQYYLGMNSIEDRGSNLKWLAALEKSSFENFNMFDEQAAGFSLRKEVEHEADSSPDLQHGYPAIEKKGHSSSLSVDSMSVILKVEAPLNSVSKTAVNNAITITANGGHVQIKMNNIFELDSKVSSSKMVVQQLLENEFASEFYKVIESKSGVTVLIRNYFDVNAHDVRRIVHRLMTYVQENTGFRPKVIVNGLKIESSAREVLWR